jgi:hypothetical protein
MYGRHRPGPLLAALTAFTFGCATVRVPVSELGEPAPLARGAIAAPEVELWIESGDPVSPAEAEQALREAHAALGSALAGRAAGAEDSEYVLYVRERAVVRTASRRTDQTLAVAGIAVAAVAIVVVVVLAVVGGKGAPSVPKAHAPSAAAAPARLVPRGVPAPPRGAPVALPLPRGGGDGTAAHPPDVDAWIDVVARTPGAAEPPPVDAWAAGPGPDPWAAPPGEDPWAGEEAAGSWGEGAVPTPALPPAAALDVSRRGFFARDAFVLDLVLVERRTGRPVWARSIQRDADARDARAVAEGIAEGLAELALAPHPAPDGPPVRTSTGLAPACLDDPRCHP